MDTYRVPSEVLIFNKKVKPKPSIVYKTYWKFAVERQNVFFARLSEDHYPWSKDKILNQYKFTNVYRSTDRVSQYLIKEILYRGDQSINELFFRAIIFKIFNRISTWEFLKTELGGITYKDYTFKKYDKILNELIAKGIAIYSAAYIMASGRSSFGYERKHQNHLKLIEKMINDNVPTLLQNCKTMHDGYSLLIKYPTIGEFLAYQYITDINYSSLTNFSEMEFVKAGPGAKDGIRKCFNDFGDYSFEDIIKMMADNQELEFEKMDLKFKTLNDRNLQLIDCQNIFCEVDKYSRIAHPDIIGFSNRTRIKQKFNYEEKDKIDFFFPPKWNINSLVIPNE